MVLDYCTAESSSDNGQLSPTYLGPVVGSSGNIIIIHQQISASIIIKINKIICIHMDIVKYSDLY